MLVVLDSNEYIFALGPGKQPASVLLLNHLLQDDSPHRLCIARTIMEEVHRHLTDREFRDFIALTNLISAIDEDFVVPFELGNKYEKRGLKPADAFIAAYVEWCGAEVLVTENRHFLWRQKNLPFRVLRAVEFLGRI